MDKELKLKLEVSERILKCMRIAESQEVCNSDLQGIAEAEAQRLIKDLKQYWGV